MACRSNEPAARQALINTSSTTSASNWPISSREWDWYFHDFPVTPVDIGVSTHAHFDHDALHRLDAHVLLDRLIGMYRFGDMTIYGFADKHATDSSCALYDFKKIHKLFHGTDVEPPEVADDG